MRSLRSVTPFIRHSMHANRAQRSRSLFSRMMLLLLMLIGGGWSHQALAARAICNLANASPTSQTGAVNSALSYSFDVVDVFACGAASGTVTIASDTTGGASISSGGTFNDTGVPPFANSFVLQLGPYPGAVSITITCTSIECAGATLTYTATAVTPTWTVVASLASYRDNDGSGSVTPGDSLDYTTVVTNTSGSGLSLTNVSITDSLGGSLACGTVADGASCTLSSSYAVTTADVGNTLTYQGRARSFELGGRLGTLSNQVTTPVVAATPGLSVVKSQPSYVDADYSGNITAGDTLTYQVVATNTGNITLNSVSINDPTVPNLALNCPNLARSGQPGDSCTATGTYVVTAADATAGVIVNTAQGISKQTGAIASNTVRTAVAASPAMTVTKSLQSSTDPDQSGNVTVGDVLTYQIAVENIGGGTLTNVTVTDPNATLGATTCATLLVGNTCTWSATHTVDAADLRSGQASNQASATSAQITTAVPSNIVNTPVFASPAMTVVKALANNADGDGSGTVTEGDVLTYTVTATNNGGGALTNVVVSDPLTTPGSITCASVAIAGSCVLSGTYTVTRADVNAGAIINTGTATARQFPTGMSSRLNTTVFTSPAATITKVLAHNQDGDHSGTVTVGDILTYTVTGTNSGNVALASMTVDDPLTTPSTITCNNVPIGGTCVLNGIYTVTAADLNAGSISNTGTASSPQLRAPVTARLVTPVLATPAMTISKALTANADGDHSGTVTVGDVLTYTVTATNSGNATLTNVTVDDPLTTPATVTCASVAVGATCVLTGTYTVTAADASNGTIRNTGSATARQLTGAVTASLITAVARTAPAMTLAKVLTGITGGDAGGNAIQGSVLAYSVTATNSGSTILGNVQISDPLTTPGTATCASLQPGQTCVLDGSHTVTAADVARGNVANTATATASQLTGSVTSNTVTTPVLTTASMSVSKQLTANADGDHSGTVTPGDVLTYTVTATNTGNVTLATVSVSDPLTTPSSATCSNVAPGATCALAGTYTVTAADASNGSISNTGSATAGAQITTPVTQTLNTPVTTLTRTIAIVSGDGQTGTTNTALADPLVVSVLDGGNPATGVVVNWAVTSGAATLASATSTVAANGQASNTITLGATAGPVTITATRADDNSKSVTFHATVAAPTLTIVSGDNQLGVVGAAAVHPLVVILRDGNGQPYASQTVNWQVVSGPATVAAASSLTDASGNAQVNFSYGASTGAIVIRASAGGASVDFHATAASYQITITGGNGQSAGPGQSLPQAFGVQVSYPAGMTTLAHPLAAQPQATAPSLAGVVVQWSVLAGGGSLAQGTSTTTDASGYTSNHYTLGPGTGLNQVQVMVPGGNTTTFTANSAIVNATLKIVSGANQNLAPGTASQPLVVELTDSSGTPLSGVTVNWTANHATVANASSVTGSDGRASNTAQVSQIGAATVTASTSSPSAGPVVFGLNGGLSFIAGLTPLQGQITGALDNACSALAAMGSLTAAQQDLLNQCNALAGSAGQNPGQTVAAINQMFADEAYLETSAAMLISTTQFDNIKARIAALRSGTGGDHFGGLAFTSPNGSLPVGSLGMSALTATDKDKGEAGAGFDRWGFFVSGTFSHGSVDPRQSLPGYGFNTNGITGGIDYRFNDHFILGVSAGYAKYSSALDAGIGRMDTSGWTLSAYSTFFQKDNWYLDGVLSWGKNSYDLSRKITYTLTGPGGTTTVSQIADGNDGGNTFAAAFTFGRDFNKGPWSFGPYFRGTWTRVSFDGYQEVMQAGPGSGLGLAVQTHPLTSTATVLGAKINYASSQSWGVFMPHAEVEWQHEFKDNPDTVTAYFLQDPTKTPINVNGFPVDNNFFRLGLGASFVFPMGRSGFIYYEKTLGRSGVTQDNIAIGLRIEF